ncbi:hypothetical protein GOODEAATRI_021833, partial [Goodea atripinnis]
TGQSASYRLNFLGRLCAGDCSPCPLDSAPAPVGTAPAWSGCSSGVWGSTTRNRRLCSPFCTRSLVIVFAPLLYLPCGWVLLKGGKRGGNATSCFPGIR